MSEINRSNPSLESLEKSFWEHVDFQMELTGQSEQQVLDAIRTPGFTCRGTWERMRSQNANEQGKADAKTW
jgi:hypothetical protein